MDPEQIPLRDLHLPDAVSWWPLAPGWWVLIALALIGLAFLVRAWLKIRARGAARRYALRQLNEIVAEYEERKNPVEFGVQLSELLRRTMLAYAPRLDVAGLTGDAWLEKIDAAWKHGCRRFDGAMRGFGGCPMAKDEILLPATKLNKEGRRVINDCDCGGCAKGLRRGKRKSYK